MGSCFYPANKKRLRDYKLISPRASNQDANHWILLNHKRSRGHLLANLFRFQPLWIRGYSMKFMAFTAWALELSVVI